jgi:hypothetical protein
MHPHLAEVVTEARLEECPRGCIERLAGRAKNLVHNGWHGRRLNPSRIRTSCWSLRSRHAHHCLRYAIGFLLVWIARLADGQFGLQPPRGGMTDAALRVCTGKAQMSDSPALHRLVAQGLLHAQDLGRHAFRM